MDPFSPDELWTQPIRDVAHNIVATATLADVRVSTIRSAVLQARVSLEVAESQKTATDSLVEATDRLVAATKRLAWVTGIVTSGLLLATIGLVVATLAG